MVVITLTDRPKSVRKHCVLERLGGVLYCNFDFWLFLLIKGLTSRTESDLVLFLPVHRPFKANVGYMVPD